MNFAASPETKRIALLLSASLTLALGLRASDPRALGPTPVVSVIVTGHLGAHEAAAAVGRVGGEVVRRLSIVDGVAAEVPAASLDELTDDERVREVAPNAPVRFNGRFDGTGPQRVARVVRSDELWDDGITGRGVTVALLDTGVHAAHADLAGRVVHCEDLSAERVSDARCKDTFGHGTFMAGLIAGDGTASGGRYVGVAPEANIVSIKVAGYDGSTDVSLILAGIQWAVAHRDAYDIRALNLSLGTDASQGYRLSPLNYAVERAWQEGIVVTVSAGNSGPDARTVMKPGDDPFVVTVGAANDQGTPAINDDRVASFSSRGPTRADSFVKPDVVAPGVHTVSLASPGSAIDTAYGETARVGHGYFRGTGTSMATATVTGIVAQILQETPELTPDQVKHRLLSTARAVDDGDPNAVGRGLVDAYRAATSNSLASSNQDLPPSTGLGSIALDRGSLGVEVATPLGQIALFGEYAATTDPAEISPANPVGLVPWVGTTWRSDGWDGTTWRDEEWDGTTWRGTTWRATVWDGTTWRGTTWRNSDWDGTTWRDADWDGTTWRASNWKSAWYAAQWD